MRRSLFATTLPEAADSGDEVLRKGGSALKAVVTGFFVAAAHRPGCLFAPAGLLVAGLGTGVRSYDGRARQPGLGQKRPRGFTPGEVVPEAARTAVPFGVAALSLACAYDTGTSFLACARPGVQAAKAQGLDARAQLLELFGSHGAAALEQPALRRAFLGQFGPAEGGNWGPLDLNVPASELDRPARLDSTTARLDFSDEGDVAVGLGSAHALVAVDGQGKMAALGFRELSLGAALEGFDVLVPLLGEPVLRGVSRFTPGSPLPLRLDLEAERDASGAWVGLRADGLGPDGDGSLRLGRDPATQSVARLA